VDAESGAQYVIDEATEADEAFVCRTWRRSYRACPEALKMPKRAYECWQDDIMGELMERGALVLVARDVETPVYSYGFLVAERIQGAVCLHWAYVKADWRERGMARALLDDAVERLGDGASELWVSHGTDIRRQGRTDTWVTKKLRDLGFTRVGIETVLRAKEAA
jgi:GNAT superfamily N-acetyltransferase